MRSKQLLGLAHQIDRDLRAIREAVRRPLELEFARGNLTGPQQSAMAAIVQSAEGISLKMLSAHLGLAHSTTSGIVDRLEKRGLVTRKTDPKDARLTCIAASAEVRGFLTKKMPELSIHPLLDALVRANPNERARITQGLQTLRMVLERQANPKRKASPSSPLSFI